MHMPAFASFLALLVVAAAGVFLVLLGLFALLSPFRARSFLLGFAATPARHYAELSLRVTVGLAFILVAPQLAWGQVLFVAGVLLVGTTAIMAVLPYRLHQTFAQRAVPRALAYLPLIGVASLAGGLALAWSAFVASVA
jgi:hypothetical protein